MRRKRIQLEGWALFASIVIGLAAGIGIFILDGHLINWIVSGMENHDLKIILKVVLWMVTFTITLAISIVVGVICGSVTKILLGG